MTDPPLHVWTRSIAIDIHKHYLMIGGIDPYKRIVLPPRRVEHGCRNQAKNTSKVKEVSSASCGNRCAAGPTGVG